MNKTQLLALVLLGFAQVNSPTQDYSKMSANELDKALIIAVEKGSYDQVQGLVQAGANGNQNITYDAGMRDWDVNITTTLLEYAAKKGYLDIVRELKVKAENAAINEALILAAKQGYPNVVRELVQADPELGILSHLSCLFVNSEKCKFCNNKKYRDIALIEAASAGNPNVIKELIKAGANINHADEHGYTALIRLVAYNTYKTTETWKKNRAEAIQDLLNAKANVNHANKNGDTALIIAIKNHDIDIVQILLNATGINFNYANNNGDTALIVALKHIETTYISGRKDQYNNCINSQKILEILLKTPGINPHHANKDGDTAVKLLNKLQGKAF